MFKESGTKFAVPSEAAGSSPQYECITPLRLLLAKERDRARWDKEVGAAAPWSRTELNTPAQQSLILATCSF